MKKEILNAETVKGSNSMGVSESYYNPYYLLKKCFTEEEINKMSEAELQIAFKVADFASEVFY